MSEHTIPQMQTASKSTFPPVTTGVLQRTCACGQHSIAGGECTQCRKEREAGIQRSPLQMKDPNPLSHGAYRSVEHPQVARGGGYPLPQVQRDLFESRFRCDFSHVRIHPDEIGGQMALAVGAEAYTQGSDIYFAPGFYRPDSRTGMALLAHELTHVVQQRNGRLPAGVDGTSSARTRSKLEGEAKAMQREFQASAGLLDVQESANTTEIYHQEGIFSTLRTGISGSLESLADRVVSEYGESIEIIAQLNSLRQQLRSISQLYFTDEELAQFEAMYQLIRTNAPSWLPVPELNFVGSQVQLAAVAIPIAAVVIILFLLLLLIILSNPQFRRANEDAAREIRDAIERALRGRPPRPETRPETRTEPGTEPSPERRPDIRRPPPPIPIPQMNAMRFQVQWNTNAGGPTFSEIAVAPSNIGVTTGQAVTALDTVHAKVRPRAAQNAADPAVVKQKRWILSRPPAGIAVGGYSKSEYFNYGNYPDARVDVENLRGHNLRV